MDGTMRATCPSCRSVLRIPAQWAGQAVKCKKCGSVVRTKAQAPVVPAAVPAAPQYSPNGSTNGPVPAYPTTPEPSPFADLAPPPSTAAFNPFDPVENGAHPYPVPAAAPLPPANPYPVPTPAAYPANPYPYPAPTAYPAPLAVEAAPVVGEFAPSEATAAYTGRRRRSGGSGKYVLIGVAVLLAVGGAAWAVAGHAIKQKLVALAGGTGTHPTGTSATGKSGTNPATSLVSSTVPFPRRLLFIQVSNYLYLNPLTTTETSDSGSKGTDRTKMAAMNLAYSLRIPRDKDNDQLYLLSDTAPPPGTRTPMKNVITATCEKFFETSRPQDRVVVYFGGHVLTKKQDDKDVTYLVPIEGDPDDPATLIPLDDFYAKLKACPATQKVVVWDVCRLNPTGDRTRPGSEPMTEVTAAALSAAPPGVQVVLTCQPGENALEFPRAPDNIRGFVAGSNFLEAARFVSDKGIKSRDKAPDPGEPIPVEQWAADVGKRVSEVATASDGKAKQTVKAAGAAPESLTAYKADDPPAARFELPPSPKGAAPAEVAAIATEFSLPPIKSTVPASGVGNFPFPAEALDPYKADVPLSEITNPANRDKYLFRVNVIEAFETVRKLWGKGADKLRTEFDGTTTDAVKKEILKEQLFPAEAVPRLERAITLLEAVEPMKAEQPKRWQANYEYALGQCKARLAFMHEYNLALGSIRTEVLPPMKKGDTGYKLVSAEKLKVKKEAKYAEEAREHFQKVIDEYKGSPWAVQAKQDRVQSLGLAWQSYNSKGGEAAAPEPAP